MKKTYKTFVESVIDPIRKTYSTSLFDNADTDSPTLKKSVRKQILDGIDLFAKIAPVKSFAMIGSSLSRQYKDNADLDINLEFDIPEHLIEVIKPKLVEHLRKVQGALVSGTQHPINYYIITTQEQNDIALARADAVFDIKNNKWIKKPKLGTQVDVQFWLDKFRDTIYSLDIMKNKFKRDLVDYKEYLQLSLEVANGVHNGLKKHLATLEADINQLIDAEQDIANKRRAAFARNLTREEMELYGSYNRLPENILYKILERYHYLDFISNLQTIIGDDRKLTKDEADQL